MVLNEVEEAELCNFDEESAGLTLYNKSSNERTGK